MSWNVHLLDDRGHEEGSWNYTHNTNGMIAEALTDLGCVNAREIPTDHVIWKLIGAPWWQRIDGAPGPVGAEFLGALVKQLESDPEKYRTMNPSNGWGDYDSLVKVLTEMRNAVPEWPTVWRASG